MEQACNGKAFGTESDAPLGFFYQIIVKGVINRCSKRWWCSSSTNFNLHQKGQLGGL